jgi:hypothetical protein
MNPLPGKSTIRGFFDESEHGNVRLVAGWVTDCGTWERLSEDWHVALDAAPSIRYFKHHEAKANPPSGQFNGWSSAAVEAKITALVDVICRHEMYGVTSGLKKSTHNAAFAGATMPRKTLRTLLKGSHYYNACVFSVQGMVAQVQIESGHADKAVDVIFDEMDGLLKECIAFFEEQLRPLLPENLRAICGSIIEANDKQVEALQAADLLAGQLTTKLRLGRPEEHYRRMARAHPIYQRPAYNRDFNRIPELVRTVNQNWSALQFNRTLEKYLNSFRPKQNHDRQARDRASWNDLFERLFEIIRERSEGVHD